MKIFYIFINTPWRRPETVWISNWPKQGHWQLCWRDVRKIAGHPSLSWNVWM